MNVADLVADAAAAHPQRPAFAGAERATWGGLDRDVSAVAAWLHGRRIGPGDKVAVVMPNGVAYARAYWGALRAGATVVPVNPAYTPPEMRHILEDSGARLALCDDRLSALVGTAVGGLTTIGLPGELVPSEGPDVAAGGDDCAVISYTSGTTGRPKGAMLTHRNLLANLESFSDLPLLQLSPEDVLLGVLPFFHIFGLNVILNAAARHGAAVLPLERFSPAGSLQAAAAAGVSVAYGAPPVFGAWAGVPDADRPALPRLRAAVSGADALPAVLFERFAAGFGIEILEGYGLTEAAPVVSSNAASPRPRAGSVGHPLPGVEVRICSDDGAELPDGEVGEIVASGANVFAGYHGHPEATAEVLRGGWLRTGDLGKRAGDGSLEIAGRLKELIIVSGFNVYPREVEEALLAHPGVADAGVVGEPDDRTGERVRALVVPRPGVTLDVDDVLRHCRGRLARYKLPRTVEVVSELPRLPSGKLLRSRLQ